MTHLVLWIYIVLVLAGGLAGWLKAGSKVSFIMAAIFGLLLALCNVGVIRPFYIADILVAVLLAVFVMRLVKTRKFMPSGLMVLLSAAALLLLLLL